MNKNNHCAQYLSLHVVLETIKQHLRILMLRQYTVQAIFLKINAKTLEHPRPCSVLRGSGGGGGRGAGHYPRTGVSMGGGVVPISDFKRLAGMQILI